MSKTIGIFSILAKLIALIVAALGMAVLTYAVLSGWASFGASEKNVRSILILLNIDLVLFLIEVEFSFSP